MSTKDKILNYLQQNKSAGGTELSNFLGISRQATNKHLKLLIQAGKIAKEGVTRGTVYSITSSDKQSAPTVKRRRSYDLLNLEEDRVFQDFNQSVNFGKLLGRKAFKITNYVFTEMVNNAIDHSVSPKCLIEVEVDQYNLICKVRDFGIGIFYSIFKKFALSDEYDAIGELIKGKATTMKEKHTGEGIFFSSKTADVISFRSHNTKLIFDNLIHDTIVEETKHLKGTEVIFRIKRRSKRELADIFFQYAPEEYDYKFNKTKVVVKLFKEDYISRSEAKRMVSRLDQFREIILDFKGVRSIGQGFADEVFRVFQNRHPRIIIHTENLLPSISAVINHVVDNRRKSRLTIG
jgi:DNA-binding MarR family transcriptional regulator